MSANQAPLSWVTIILAVAAVAVVVNLTLGWLGTLVPLPWWLSGAISGAIIGPVAVILFGRRQARLGRPMSR